MASVAVASTTQDVELGHEPRLAVPALQQSPISRLELVQILASQTR